MIKVWILLWIKKTSCWEMTIHLMFLKVFLQKLITANDRWLTYLRDSYICGDYMANMFWSHDICFTHPLLFISSSTTFIFPFGHLMIFTSTILVAYGFRIHRETRSEMSTTSSWTWKSHPKYILWPWTNVNS